MMDVKNNLIVIKGELKTSDIVFCRYNNKTKKWDVKFNNGKLYSYAYENVEKICDSEFLNPNIYQISRAGKELFDIAGIYAFKGKKEPYYRICFKSGACKEYKLKDLDVVKSCLSEKESQNVFKYIKQIASLSELKNEDTGDILLEKAFESISFVGENVALAKYLNPSKTSCKKSNKEYIPIFPFGCNNSQYSAVKNAMENQISVIQGPPGTGKTQTILNIIANILMQGKTVQVVSNNNSATENVYEKLSSSKYNLGFIVASLGNSKHKNSFIENQSADYPDLKSWKIDENSGKLEQEVYERSAKLKKVFDSQEKLATLRHEKSQIDIEQKYFLEHLQEKDINEDILNIKSKISAKAWMGIWQECQMKLEENQKIGIFFKLKMFFKYRLSDWTIYSYDYPKMISIFQLMYYRVKRQELDRDINTLEKELSAKGKGMLDDLCDISMKVLKDKLARKYGVNHQREIFTKTIMRKKPEEFLKEYPVILSTTFSSRKSLNKDVIYDYVIMDEASQVDIATGALALSSAKNVVIVGDSKQLPNVVTADMKKKADAIFESFNINKGYKFTNSFLNSILEVIPDVTETLLREHYRCHPKIIDFCNKKFYRDELVVMTSDKGEEDVLSVIKTVKGNHARNHYSQRQIDVIKEELIPKYNLDLRETGIIAPYRNQVNALRREVCDVEIATVHKFQGKEKDNIIISTVDDEISDFADDPYLLNVAVSRAKKKLMLVVSGNEQNKEHNITDLIDYIKYNNFEVTDSKINSVFDYLYKQFGKERREYLSRQKKVSQFDSENLLYALLEEILLDNEYSELDVVCHFPMNTLIKSNELLSDRELEYAMNPATHLDFLIFNRISKKPMAAIEVDGYKYHKDDTVQASRDKLKNHIMELWGIHLLRLNTTGSNEKQKIIELLDMVTTGK